jgi:uncharacterized membrane protein HdeD (DUF308 family)
MAEATMTAEERMIPWWVVLIEGIAAIIIGILLLINPMKMEFLLVQFLGIYWFIVGIIDIVRIFIDSSQWGWKLFSGIIGILAGLAIINYPLWSSLLVPAVFWWMFGFFGIIIGIIGLIQAFQGAGWGAGILGVLSILFGLLLVSNALKFSFVTPFLFGILGIVGGLAALVMAFQMRSA